MKHIDITYENFQHVEKIDVNIVMNLQRTNFFTVNDEMTERTIFRERVLENYVLLLISLGAFFEEDRKIFGIIGTFFDHDNKRKNRNTSASMLHVIFQLFFMTLSLISSTRRQAAYTKFYHLVN